MSSKRIFNIIVVTSTFWFSVTVLVLMFNSEVTRESLTMLNAPVVLDSDKHHYMEGAGVNPLGPVDHQKHIKYPWEKDSSGGGSSKKQWFKNSRSLRREHSKTHESWWSRRRRQTGLLNVRRGQKTCGTTFWRPFIQLGT